MTTRLPMGIQNFDPSAQQAELAGEAGLAAPLHRKTGRAAGLVGDFFQIVPQHEHAHVIAREDEIAIRAGDWRHRTFAPVATITSSTPGTDQFGSNAGAQPEVVRSSCTSRLSHSTIRWFGA